MKFNAVCSLCVALTPIFMTDVMRLWRTTKDENRVQRAGREEKGVGV